MSEKSSDDADKAWDDDPKDEPAAESGEAEVHRVDTVPPPASGDAYSADTVIRDVPREALDAIREKRKSSEKRRAAESSEASSKEPAVTTEKTTAEKSPDKSAEKPAEKAAAKPAAEKPIARKVAAAVVHAPSRSVAPPVTSGEILIAFGAAVALIVIGFYVIGSAF
jgi:FtsZ-interacting cell division protein ZipA